MTSDNIYSETREVCRRLAQAFNKVPRRSEIPDPIKDWYGRRIVWRVGDIIIKTYSHTMGRVFARAEWNGKTAETYATNHKAAVRALIRWALTYFKEA